MAAGFGLGLRFALFCSRLLPRCRLVPLTSSKSEQPETANGLAGRHLHLGPPGGCLPENPSQFFTQAAGHPPAGFTQIIVKHSGLFETPVGNLKTVLVDLPPG